MASSAVWGSTPGVVKSTVSPDSAVAQLDKMQAQLDDLATAMRFALRTNQTVALDMFRGQFKNLSRAAAALRAQLNAQETPSTILVAMDVFSDKVVRVANEVGADASDLAKGLGATLKNLPVILGALAVLAVVVAVFYFAPKRRGAA